MFVRFFGCNLGCSFCDTKPDSYNLRTTSDLLDEIKALGVYHSLSVTGGEPLLQIEFLKDLLKHIKLEGQKVYLETNGILWENLKKVLDYIDIVAMDFKLPSSTGLKPFWGKHKKFLKIAGNKDIFIKVIIGRETNIEDIRKTIEIIKETRRNSTLVLQPQNPVEIMVKGKIKNFEEVCKKEGIKTKVIPQLHKRWGLK